jgi:NhaA family Na+:H+ antiporter
VHGSTEVSADNVVFGAGLVALLVLCSAAGINRSAVYGLLGIMLWIVAGRVGIHPTVVGVILAMMVPGWTRIDASDFIDRADGAVATFQCASQPVGVSMSNPHQQESLDTLRAAVVGAQSPLMKIENFLHPVVMFFVVPVFALANAGVALRNGAADWLAWPVVGAIAIGIVLAKPVGVIVACRLAIASGLVSATSRTTAGQLYGLGEREGAGFIIALFITSVAFEGNPLLDSARLGVLIGSLLLGMIGCLVLARIRSDDRAEATVIAFPTIVGPREHSRA